MKNFKQSPLFNDGSHGPPEYVANWVVTKDKIRIRVVLWSAKTPIGTVFICPGYSEYIEKYGKTAKLFSKYGYSSVSLDWRGHGLSDRLTPNPLLGHIETFSDYLKDFDAIIEWAQNFDLPKPWFVLGHSMGGAILLRKLHENKHFNAVAFSKPLTFFLFDNTRLGQANCDLYIFSASETIFEPPPEIKIATFFFTEALLKMRHPLPR